MRKLIESMSEMKILIVGETIIDEYNYVYPMAKSTKENIIATRFQSSECFRGGVAAAKAHLDTFCKKVDVITQFAEIKKSRFIDSSYMRKLFEVYYMDEDAMSEGVRYKTTSNLASIIGQYDCVIVFDFGHGFIDGPMVNVLCEKAKFLAVNVQSNSGNMGFNFIHKYRKADYICIDEPEARLAAIDRCNPIHNVIEHLRELTDCPKWIITHGKYGCVTYDDGDLAIIPALTDTVLDTVGAGDAFMSITAPLVARNANLREVGFLGNVAGMLKTGIIGHKQPVRKEAVIKWLDENYGAARVG